VSEICHVQKKVIGDSAMWRTQTVEMFSWCKCKKTLVVNVGVQVVPSYIAYIT
jgi:hypothetical protein